jgi:hypothetical protein
MSQLAQAQIDCNRSMSQPAQTKIDCNSCWAEGMPLPGHPGGPIMCDEYTPDEDSDVVLGGSEYRIFLEHGLDAADYQPQMTWMAEAIDETVGGYHFIGDKPVFFIYVSSSEPPDTSDISKYVMATASRGYDSDNDEPCPVFFYPYGMSASYEDFKQAVAHEAFHCVQSALYWDQMSGSRDNRWWLEGTAMYFSNVVYPDFNQEWPFSGNYDPGNSDGTPTLFDHVYGSNFFFQYLANRIGNGDDGILGLIESMPTVAGPAPQHDALSAFPGMADHWHGFGEHYLDRQVHDTGTLIVNVEPDRGEPLYVSPSANETVNVTPFTLYRREIIFDSGHSYNISVDTMAGDGQYSAREIADGAEWGPMPDMVVTDCDAPARYQFLATSTSPAAAPPYAVRIFIEETPSCGCKPPHQFDTCVVGTWELDEDSMNEVMEELLEGRLERRPTRANHIMTITADGLISGNHTTTDTSIINTPPAGRQELRHVRTGSYKAKVQNASKYSLMFCDVESDLTSSATMNGAPMELGPMTQFSQTPDPMFSDVEGYECSKFQLKMYRTLPTGVQREFRFDRIN